MKNIKGYRPSWYKKAIKKQTDRFIKEGVNYILFGERKQPLKNMKTEDIERFIEKFKPEFEKEGFEVSRYSSGSPLFQVKTKDPWQDVEFAELVTAFIGLDLQEGMVGKVISNDGNRIEVRLVNGDICYSNLNEFKPSTEQAYFEQLKKEAFERFGEIKEGDSFERCWEPKLDQRRKFTIGDRYYATYGFSYDKELDSLKFDGHSIYKYGKWATKLPKKAKVTFITSSGMSNNGENGKFIGGDYKFTFKIENVEHKNLHHIGDFLSQQLEKYLNDEN